VLALYGEGDDRINSWERGDQGTQVDVAIDSVAYVNMPAYVRKPANYPSSLQEILATEDKAITVKMPGFITDTLTTFGNDETTSIYNVFEGARFVKFQVQSGVGDHMSNDFPIFRLADAYLMKAEALMLANGGAATAEAVDAVNMVRNRAGATPYNTGTLTLDELCNERVRELCWEGFRRQDLIRFGRFEGEKSYAQDGDIANLWVFRTKDNAVFDGHKNIFPFPEFIISNYQFKQNPGY
jgi:hypothetical protein